MFLSKLLRRVREKNQKKGLLKDLILGLKIDENQRFLYLESLELLDDEGLSSFYERLVAFAGEVEGRYAVADGQMRTIHVRDIRSKEQQERSIDANNANFLFDNV